MKRLEKVSAGLTWVFIVIEVIWLVVDDNPFVRRFFSSISIILALSIVVVYYKMKTALYRNIVIVGFSLCVVNLFLQLIKSL